MKVLALILDALDAFNLYQFNFEYLQHQYEENGDVLGCATIPHTAASNPMIWGGVENKEKFWIDNPEAEEDKPYMDPAQYFDRDEGEPVEGAEIYTREDFNDTFVWDDLTEAGYDARALQVPITLPPYSFRVTETLESSWFPDNQSRMGEHIRKKPKLIKKQFSDGADFVATSIQMPDKWLHGVAENECSIDWAEDESAVLDNKIEDLIDYCRANDIHWMIFGDHGSPCQGAMLMDDFILPRHQKESIIISDLDVPVYTDELYEYFLDLFDAQQTNITNLSFNVSSDDKELEEVTKRLENLGYM